MLISLNILKKFVDIPEEISADEIANLLTMKTMEIEGFVKKGKYWQDVIIGEVKSVEKHPQADRLVVAKVDIGKEPLLNIVCGGTNVQNGMLVAVAPVGAKVLWHGDEEMLLEKTKIRGVESEGMICAGSEIGLADLLPIVDDKYILDLSDMGWEKGKSLKEYLKNDVIFEVDNKSINHRPDLWGHYGIARELRAILKTQFKHYNAIYNEEIDLEISENSGHIDIKDKILCDHYLAIKVKNVEDKESPLWLKEALNNLGIKSISALVDLSNYIMLESGQPMHVFDADKVFDDKIIVRAAEDEEKFTALDEEDYFLKKSDIVIADKDGAIALAGVMGGLDSGFTTKTKEVILEFAHFPATTIRRTSMHLGLRTEASMRFEKALDPKQLEFVAKRTWQLIKEIFPKAEVEWTDQVKSFDEDLLNIDIPLSEFTRVAGIEIEKSKIEDTLMSLGFGVNEKDDLLKVTVPSWRATKDVTLPIDLVEEVLRIYGYDNINRSYPTIELSPVIDQDKYELKRRIKDFLVLNAGMNEIYNYSFLQLNTIKKLGIEDVGSYIYLDKPVDKTRPVLRDDLIYNLLENIVNNEKNISKMSAFEMGRIFLKDNQGQYDVAGEENAYLPKQTQMLAGFMYDKENEVLFYDLKELIRQLFKFLSKSYIIEEGAGPSWMHPYKTMVVKVHNDKGEVVDIGYFGLINPFVLKEFSIDSKVAYFSLDFDLLAKVTEEDKRYKAINKYPAIDLDISVLLSKDITWKNLKDYLTAQSELIKSIELVDRYEQEEWSKDNKYSLTLRLYYQSEEKTLEMDELNKIHNKIKKSLAKKFDLEIR